MSEHHPATILAFLINLSAWLFREIPTRHHQLLAQLQIYPTPLLKAIAHAQQILANTHLTLETLQTLGVPDIIQDTLRLYDFDPEENPLDRRDRLAMNPLIVEMMVIKLTHAIQDPDINPSERRELEQERQYWDDRHQAHGHAQWSRHSSCHA